MTQDSKPPQDSPLARWSRLKREAAREKGRATAQTAAAAPSVVASAGPATSPAASVATLSGTAPPVSLGVSPPVIREVDGNAPRSDELPPVESLTFDSDFAPYFQPQVDAVLKRQALKQLLRDPRFNVMDGLDVYIDDYSQPDPIPPEIVREMVQGRYIFDPPPTRINAQGHVEDVPPDELAALKDAKAANEHDALASGGITPALADTANAAPRTAAASLATPSPADEAPPAAISPDAPVAKDDSAR